VSKEWPLSPLISESGWWVNLMSRSNVCCHKRAQIYLKVNSVPVE
jgi:hypothetical protein